ncbi:MAG: hypothetical protein ABSE89_01125 [Sedimentisphaerales bacterium]
MKNSFACILLLFLAIVSTNTYGDIQKIIELKLYAAMVAEPNKYQLLPKNEEQNDLDAMPLYIKALQALPADFKSDQINQLLKNPLNELPFEQAQSTLKEFKPALQLIEQAAMCKKCNWPFEVEVDSKILQNYRRIAQILALQTRLEIAQGRYDNAISTIRTGFAMGRDLSKSSAMMQDLIGISAAALMLGQLEQFIQAPDAPNLYQSLQSIPRPFIDLTGQIETESEESTREKIRLLMNRLDRHIAVLQCVEALRHYAAGHNGKFPGSLADIKELPIPNDPVTGKPFDYSGSNSEAVLKGPAPNGAESDKAIYYRLVLREPQNKNKK